MMMLRLLAILLLLGVGACNDHRAEDVCDKLCSCQESLPSRGALCRGICEAELGSEPAISDACFTCIEQASCVRVGACEAVCEDLGSGGDDGNSADAGVFITPDAAESRERSER